MIITDLKSMLIEHEGFRLKLYKCTAGKNTIGAGRNLDDVGISREEGLFLCDNDIKRSRAEALSAFPWYPRMNQPRQDVVASMIFNLGLLGFLKFRKTIIHLECACYDKAAVEMLDSLWAKQVGQRAIFLSVMMRTGVYP